MVQMVHFGSFLPQELLNKQESSSFIQLHFQKLEVHGLFWVGKWNGEKRLLTLRKSMEELLAQLDQDEARDWEDTWLALVVDSRIERLKKC